METSITVALPGQEVTYRRVSGQWYVVSAKFEGEELMKQPREIENRLCVSLDNLSVVLEKGWVR
jgi:cell fate (sporulation/competence/biofilm development) regulator YlbF (YheA/YmcA/DUF963 family)